MKVIELKKKYPEIWNNVYKGVVNDLRLCMPSSDVEQQYKDGYKGRIDRIAHNAAFLACNEIHKKLKKITESNIKNIINS